MKFVKTLGFDYGTPPDSVLDQERRIKALSGGLTPKSVADDSVSLPGAPIEGLLDEQPNGETLSVEQPVLKPAIKTQTERVELEYVPENSSLPSFRLSFMVGDVCIREHYVSMLIVTDLGFQPNASMRFNLKYRGRVIPVIFLGAEFEFPTVGIRGISFLIDDKRRTT